MRPENIGKLEKIKTISSILWQISGLLLVFLPICILVENFIVLAGKEPFIRVLENSYPIAGAPLRNRVAVIVMVDLLSGIAMKRLYHLFKLFGNYASGEVFTTDSARQIRQLGITALLVSGLMMVSVFVPPPILAHQPDAFRIGIIRAFDGAAVIAISWIMEMAAELREESELTV